MLYQLSRDSRYVSRFPCEVVPIFLEEFDENEFLFRVQTISDMSYHRGLIGDHRLAWSQRPSVAWSRGDAGGARRCAVALEIEVEVWAKPLDFPVSCSKLDIEVGDRGPCCSNFWSLSLQVYRRVWFPGYHYRQSNGGDELCFDRCTIGNIIASASLIEHTLYGSMTGHDSPGSAMEPEAKHIG
jgi:hypothetical protein